MAGRFEIIAALDRAARLSTPEVRDIFLSAIAMLQEQITAGELAAAVSIKSAGPILDSGAWVSFVDVFSEAFQPDGPLHRAMVDAMSREASVPPLDDFEIDIADLDAAAAGYIERHGAELVREVSESTRQGVRRAVSDAFSGRSGDLRSVARQMVDEKLFGLTARQQAALDKWAARLLGRSRDSRADDFGMSRREVGRRIRVEQKKRIRQRAITIGQTESYNAGNESRILLWEDAVDRGLLDDQEFELEWVTRSIKVCPRCKALHGKRAKIKGGIFTSDPVASGTYAGQIIIIRRPTVHPRCFCGLRTARVAKRRGRRAA